MTAPQRQFAPGMPDPAAGDLSQALGNPAPPPTPPQQQLGPVSPTETAAAQIAANPGVLVDNIGAVLQAAPILKQAPETALAAAQSATPINDAQTIAGLAHARSAQLAVIQPQSASWIPHLLGIAGQGFAAGARQDSQYFTEADTAVSNAVHNALSEKNVLKTVNALVMEPDHVARYISDVYDHHGWEGVAKAIVPMVTVGLGSLAGSFLGSAAGPEGAVAGGEAGTAAGTALGDELIGGAPQAEAAGGSVAKTIGSAIGRTVNVAKPFIRAARLGAYAEGAVPVAENAIHTATGSNSGNFMYQDSWVRTGQAGYVNPLTKLQVSPGRSLAGLFFKPGTGPYSDLSGFADAIFTLTMADPLGGGGGLVGEARSAEGLKLFGKVIGGYSMKDSETLDKLITSPIVGAPLRRAFQWVAQNDAATIGSHYQFLQPIADLLGNAKTPEAVAQVFKDGLEGNSLATGVGKVPDALIDGYTKGMLLPKYGITDAFREGLVAHTPNALTNLPKRLIARTGYTLDRSNNIVKGVINIEDPRSIPAMGNVLRKLGVSELAVRANMNALYGDATGKQLINTYIQIMSAAIKSRLLDSSDLAAAIGAGKSDAIDKAIKSHIYSDVGTGGEMGVDMYGNDLSLTPNELGDLQPRAVMPNQKSELHLPSARAIKESIYSDPELKAYTNESKLHAFGAQDRSILLDHSLLQAAHGVNSAFKYLILLTIGTPIRMALSEVIPALFREGPAGIFDGAMARWTQNAEIRMARGGERFLPGEAGLIRNATANVLSHFPGNDMISHLRASTVANFGHGYLDARGKEKLVQYAADLLYAHDGHFTPDALAGGHTGNPVAMSYDDLENNRTTIFNGPRKNKIQFHTGKPEYTKMMMGNPQFFGAWANEINGHAESPFGRTVATILREEEAKASSLGDPWAMTEAARKNRVAQIREGASARVASVIKNIYTPSLPDLSHFSVSSMIQTEKGLVQSLGESDITPEQIAKVKQQLMGVRRALGARGIVPAVGINDPEVTAIANGADHGFVKLTLNKDAAHASELDGLQRSLRTKNPLISSFQSHANDITDKVMNSYYRRNLVPHMDLLENIYRGEKTLPGDLARKLVKPEYQIAPKGAKGKQKTLSEQLSEQLKATPKFESAPVLADNPHLDWMHAPGTVTGLHWNATNRNLFEFATTPVYSAFRRIITGFSRDPQYLAMYYKFRQPLDAAVEAGDITEGEAQMLGESRASQHMLQFVHNPQDRSFLSDVLSLESPFFFAQEQAIRRVGRLLMENPGAFEQYMKANLMLQNFTTIQASTSGQPYIVLPGSPILGKGVGKLLQFFSGGTAAGLIPWGLTGSFDSLKSVDPFGASSGSQMGIGANTASALLPNLGPIAAVPLKGLSEIFAASLPRVAADINDVLGPIGADMPIWTQFVPNSALQHVIEGSVGIALSNNPNAVPNSGDNAFYSSLISAIQAISSQPGHYPFATDTKGQQHLIQQARAYTGIMWLLKTVLSFGSPVALSLAQANIKMHDYLQAEITKNGLAQGTLNYFIKYPDATPNMTFKSYDSEKIGSWPETQNAYNWIESNMGPNGIINKYQHAAPYLAPSSIQTGAFSDPAYQLQLADGLRQLRSPADFINQMYIVQGNAEWYNIVMPKINAMYTASPGNPANYQYEQAQLKLLTRLNPIWGAYKAGNLEANLARTTIGEFKKAASDPTLADNPNMPAIKTMLGQWNTFETQYQAASQTQQSQLKEAWYNQTTADAVRAPEFAPMITQVFRRATP